MKRFVTWLAPLALAVSSASAQQIPIDRLPKPAPLDSLKAFVLEAADQIIPKLLSGIDQMVHPRQTMTKAERERLRAVYAKADSAAGPYIPSWEYPDSVIRHLELSALMRRWVVWTPEIRDQGGLYLANDLMRFLAPIAVEGVMADELAVLGTKLLALGTDSAVFAAWADHAHAKTILREGAALGDPNRYRHEILGNGDFCAWWVQQARAHLMIGMAAFMHGDLAKARRELDTAYALGPREWEISVARGRIEAQAGNKAGALIHFGRAVQGWNSTTAAVLFDSAYASLHGGKLDGAQELLDSLYLADPKIGNPIVVQPYPKTGPKPRRRVMLSFITALH